MRRPFASIRPVGPFFGDTSESEMNGHQTSSIDVRDGYMPLPSNPSPEDLEMSTMTVSNE